jgi:hypothetical protein
MGVSGVVHFNPPVTYFLNDFLNGDPLYLGKSAGGNAWLVQKFSTSTGAMRYATQGNNPAIMTYADAWANKLTLQYDLYQVVTP